MASHYGSLKDYMNSSIKKLLQAIAEILNGTPLFLEFSLKEEMSDTASLTHFLEKILRERLFFRTMLDYLHEVNPNYAKAISRDLYKSEQPLELTEMDRETGQSIIKSMLTASDVWCEDFWSPYGKALPKEEADKMLADFFSFLITQDTNFKMYSLSPNFLLSKIDSSSRKNDMDYFFTGQNDYCLVFVTTCKVYMLVTSGGD